MILAAYPLLMDNTRFRNKHNAQTALPKAHAPVQVLAVKKIPFIQQTDLLNRFAFNHHA